MVVLFDTLSAGNYLSGALLGKISRRGNRYLRALFVQAAWVVLIRPKQTPLLELLNAFDQCARSLPHWRCLLQSRRPDPRADHPCAQPFAEQNVMEYRAGIAGSFRLDTRELY